MDFLIRGPGLAACPVVCLEGGPQPFTTAEQVGKMGFEVGEIRDVGAEVLAAQAAESERAGVAAGGHVGRFAADAVSGGDLADRAADVFGIQQALRSTPDPLPVPVELESRDAVDSFAAPFGADT
ncbi:hypothetical protein ACTWQF_10615 [Streptomyces sp. 8N114]|uniref:hypothetical protein n=1 Tax=Streptomyces sp. 8N114 TaxID=3457419 RepID=UPI003FD245FA